MTGVEKAAPPTGRERARAAGDSAWLVVARLVVAAFGWAGSILTARSLDPEAWGQFSLVFALLGMMAIVTDIGVGRAVLGRLMDDDTAVLARVAGSFVALRAVLGVLGYVLAVAYTLVTDQPGQVVTATLVAGWVVLVATPSHALTVLYQSRLRMRTVAFGDIASQCVQLSAVVVVVLGGGGMVWFVVPAVVNEVVNLAWRARGIARGELGYRPARRFDIGLWGSMLRESVPLTAGFALVLLLTKLDVLMLDRLDGTVAVGRYAVAYKFADVLTLVALTAIQPVTALLVAAWPADRTAFRDRFGEAAAVLAVVGGLGVAAFVPVAGSAITLLYGAGFAPAVTPARLLFLAAAGTAITQLGVQTLIAADHRRLFPLVAGAGLLLNIALNLVAIPRWSTTGAAGATLVTEAVMVAAFWIAVHRTVGWPWLTGARQPAAVGVVAATVAVAGAWAVDALPAWAWPLVAVVCTAVYCAVVVATGLVDRRVTAAVVARIRRWSRTRRREGGS